MTEDDFAGIYYRDQWANPDEAMQQEMAESGLTSHCVYGYFIVADISAMNIE